MGEEEWPFNTPSSGNRWGPVECHTAAFEAPSQCPDIWFSHWKKRNIFCFFCPIDDLYNLTWFDRCLKWFFDLINSNRPNKFSPSPDWCLSSLLAQEAAAGFWCLLFLHSFKRFLGCFSSLYIFCFFRFVLFVVLLQFLLACSKI